MMALGRHLGQGKYISGLAGFPLEDMAITKAIETVKQLEPATRRKLGERLDSLPRFPELSEAAAPRRTTFDTLFATSSRACAMMISPGRSA